jgi:alpha-tubulin suppressor-like RCC1 family protein
VTTAGQGVWACGSGRDAQLGQGDNEDYREPVLVQDLPAGASYIDVAVGWTQNFLLTSTHARRQSLPLVSVCVHCRVCVTDTDPVRL